MLGQQIVNGLTIGGIYALVAVGFTLVYGVLRLLNFAHKGIFTWGAYLCLAFILMGIPFYLAMVMAMVGTALMGFVSDYFAFKPLRKAPRLSALISAIGLYLVLENVARLIWGATPRVYPRAAVPTWLRQVVIAEPVRITGLMVFIWVVTLVMVVGLWILVNRTKIGKAMRAVAQDMTAASLMGINVNRVVHFTFALGGFLGGAAGVLLGLQFVIHPAMGFLAGIKAFAACVLGGIGNVWGAVLGGFIIGAGETLGAGYIHSGYRDAIAYALMVAIIILRPSGLLGAKVVRR